VCLYQCAWDSNGNIVIGDKCLKLNEVVRLETIPHNMELKEIFYPSTLKDIFNNTPSYRFAEMIGLKWYKWTSFHYFEIDGFIHDDFLGDIAIYVDTSSL